MVRLLAIQTDSPHLAAYARPCWETISTSFPNVETLYLMKAAIKGELVREKALVRTEESDRQKELRDKFDEWKKGAGKGKPMDKLEFVVVVDKEPDSVKLRDRYKFVKERRTGLPEDIVLG
jgi:hypothetical protein